MKKWGLLALVCLMVVVGVSGTALAKSDAATIQGGTITASNGDTITVGYDQWGYNYQAHMFNGLYDNYLRPATPAEGPGDQLIMKWNDAWLANTDADGDGKLDRHYGFPTYIGSGAWMTNHVSGVDPDTGEKWTYFVKIVAAPADATVTDGVWYAADGTEIGVAIWGAFAIVQELESGGGSKYVSPFGPGFGKF
ncbi:MAG: hypothetical protein ACYC33_11270 [Thermoleophilia bacterium]